LLRFNQFIPPGEREPINDIKDGIMRKDTKTAKLTQVEIDRNKQISKKRYTSPCGIENAYLGCYY